MKYRKQFRLSFGCALVRSVVGQKNPTKQTKPCSILPTNQKSNQTNRALLARVFPRLAQFTCECLRALRLPTVIALVLVSVSDNNPKLLHRIKITSLPCRVFITEW